MLMPLGQLYHKGSVTRDYGHCAWCPGQVRAPEHLNGVSLRPGTDLSSPGSGKVRGRQNRAHRRRDRMACLIENDVVLCRCRVVVVSSSMSRLRGQASLRRQRVIIAQAVVAPAFAKSTGKSVAILGIPEPVWIVAHRCDVGVDLQRTDTRAGSLQYAHTTLERMSDV
jgi:hypothetical protein